MPYVNLEREQTQRGAASRAPRGRRTDQQQVLQAVRAAQARGAAATHAQRKGHHLQEQGRAQTAAQVNIHYIPSRTVSFS